MAGIKINNDNIRVSSVSGDNLIPTATPSGNTAQVCSVSQIFSYLMETTLGTPDIPTFNTATIYQSGSLVIYNNKLYKFTQLHNAGAWNASHVEETTVWTELLNSTITQSNTENITVTFSSTDNNLTVSGMSFAVHKPSGDLALTANSSGVATFSVDKGEYYTLEFSQEVGYYDMPNRTYKAKHNERNISVIYTSISSATRLETVTIGLRRDGVPVSSDPDTFDEGATVQLNYAGLEEPLEALVNSSTFATFTVPFGTEYTITFPDIQYYSTPLPMTFTACMYNRTVLSNYYYYVGDDHVVIVDENGITYTAAAWTALETKPNYAAILVSPPILADADNKMNDNRSCAFYLDPDNMKSLGGSSWLGSNILIPTTDLPNITGQTSGTYPTDIKYDFYGEYNTNVIISFATSNNLTANAATKCAAESITINGVVHLGYLPSFGQIWKIKEYNSLINACLTALGKNTFNMSTGNWWSSTLSLVNGAWGLNGGSPYSVTKTYSFSVLAVYAI